MSEHLQGYFDYLLRNKSCVIVIEAKHEDLYNGFTQLATEMIALDQWDKAPDGDRLLGAVTTGSVWQFGLLHRQAKLIQQDLNLYRVPNDFETVIRILVQALIGENQFNTSNI